MYMYNSCFIIAIKYSMLVTNFNKKEWNTILAPALDATLNKSAMVAKFLCKVFYGLDLYDGMNIQHHYYR